MQPRSDFGIQSVVDACLRSFLVLYITTTPLTYPPPSVSVAMKTFSTESFPLRIVSIGLLGVMLAACGGNAPDQRVRRSHVSIGQIPTLGAAMISDIVE